MEMGTDSTTLFSRRASHVALCAAVAGADEQQGQELKLSTPSSNGAARKTEDSCTSNTAVSSLIIGVSL